MTCVDQLLYQTEEEEEKSEEATEIKIDESQGSKLKPEIIILIVLVSFASLLGLFALAICLYNKRENRSSSAKVTALTDQKPSSSSSPPPNS